MLDLHQYAVSPITPQCLDHYYANRTPVTQQLLEALLELHNLDEHLPTAAGTYGRGSNARSCIRQGALDHLRVPEDFPFSGATRMTFAIGKHIHAVLQTAWHTTFHTAEPCTGTVDCPAGIPIEQVCDLTPEWDFSGHIDLNRPTDHGVESIEIKSVSDYSYKIATGRYKGDKGPKLDHVVQAGEYALGIGAEWVRIIYVNKGKHDAITEWLIPFDAIEHLVVEDLKVQEEAAASVEGGMLPGRWSPDHGYIETVPEHVSRTGKWGTPFFCSGCRWNDLCPTLPTGPVPLADLGVEVPS